MVNVGMAVVSTLIANGIGFVVEQLDNYIHRLDIAKEKLSNTQSELDTVNSEITETNKKIAELTALDPSSLSITDKEDLQRLKDQNEELRIRQQYLKDQAKYDAGEVAKYAKEKYQKKYSGETTRENIDAYKSTMYSEYDDAYVNTGYSIYENPNFSPSAQAEYESDTLTVLIATLEHLREERQKAIDAQDSEAIEEYNTQIKETEASLRAERLELQGLRDDMEAVGGVEFEDANHRIGMIDNALYTHGQNLVSFINEDVVEKDRNKLVELAESGKLTSNELKNSFSEVNEYLKNNGLTIEDLISILDVYKEEIQVIEEEARKIPSTKSQMIDTINSMADGFDVLDDIYADVLDGGTFDFTKLDTKKFTEAFSGLEDEYTAFIETVSGSPDDINMCQKAFEDLITAFIEQKGILNNLTDENMKLTASMLENMGVVNAEEVIISSLNSVFGDYEQVKREAANAGIDLLNATDAEINSLIQEKLVSEETAQALFRYQLQKKLANDNGVRTIEDCVHLENLAKAAGYTGSALLYLVKIKALLNDLEVKGYTTDSLGYKSIMSQVSNYNKLLQQLTISEKDATITAIEYGGANETLADKQKNAKDSTKKLTEALEKEKDALEEQKETLDKLASAITSFYDKKIKKLNEEKDTLDKNIKSWDDLSSAISWFLNGKTDELDKFIDKLNESNDALQNQLNDMDSILSVIDRVYSDEIKLIQEKIDKLDEANDEKEKEIALEEARIALEEARNRKSVLTFQKGVGFTYQVDQKAIKDAESNLADLEAQVENEAVKKALQEQLDKLQELKDAYGEIPNAYKESLEELEAIAKFGTNYKDVILGSDMNSVNNLKNQYTGIQKEQDTNNKQIGIYEEQKKQIEEIIQFWDSAANKWEEDQNRMKLSAFFGSDYETSIMNMSMEKWNEYVTEYENAQNKLSDVEKQIEGLEKLKAAWEESFNAFEEKQNEALLKNFFGSDYEYELLNNSATWRKKYADEYVDICTQIEELEKRIKEANEETTESIVGNSEKTSKALRGTKQAAEETGNISKYIWTDADTAALEYARGRLNALNELIEQGRTELVGARDKVQAFVEKYAELEDTRIVTDDLKNSVKDLNNVYAESDDYLGKMASGVTGRLSDMSNYTTEVATNAQNTVDSLSKIDEKLQSVKTSEEKLDTTVQGEVSNLDITVGNILTKLGELQTAFDSLVTARQKISEISDIEVTDTSYVVTDIQKKVTEIKTAIEELYKVVSPLQETISSLIDKINLLDDASLETLIATIGSKKGASSLFGVINNVISRISVDENCLLKKLDEVNNASLDKIISEFNGEDSLLKSVEDVKNAISNDGECLVSVIKSISETIKNIDEVSNSFSELENQVESCTGSVNDLKDAIDSLEDKNITITTTHVENVVTNTVENPAPSTQKTTNSPSKTTGSSASKVVKPVSNIKASAYAKGTRNAKKGISEVGEEGAEIITDGKTAVLVESPTLVNMQGGETVYNADETEKILNGDGLKSLDENNGVIRLKKMHEMSPWERYEMQKKLLDSVANYDMPPLTHYMPAYDYEGKVVNNSQNNATNITIGEIHLHEVQNADGLSKEIINKLPMKMAQALSNRNLHG